MVLVMVVSFVMTSIMMRNMQNSQDNSAQAFDTESIPRSNVFDQLPVVMGKVVIKDANCIYYGDISAKEVETDL